LNGPFTSGAFGTDKLNGNQYRLVGMSVRARYMGTTLNQSGLMITLEQPAHDDLQSLDWTSARRFDQAKSFPMSKNWTYVTYRPTSSDELDFRTNQVTGLIYSSGVGVPPANFNISPNYVIGIAFSGLQNGSTIDFEACQIIEYVGSFARSATPTTADSVGMDAVLSATASAGSGSVDHSPAAEKSILNKTLDHLANQSSNAINAVASAAIGGAARLASNQIIKKLSGYDLLDTPASFTIEYPN
jgi:hypothetical protein